MNEDTEKQNGKQHKRTYDWLKQYQFQKGQSGNPGGVKKGKRMKTLASEIIENMSDEEKSNWLNTQDNDFIWRMAEGNPAQDTDITSKGERIMVLPATLIDKNDTQEIKSDDAML